MEISVLKSSKDEVKVELGNLTIAEILRVYLNKDGLSALTMEEQKEMALMAAICIQGLEDVDIVCLATDGTDGPTDASGAWADGTTLQRAKTLGLDPWDHLENNNAYPFFAAIDDLLLTGPTHTNVNDLTFVFVW